MATTTPVLLERAGDLGWLASTPPDYPLRFAVRGESVAAAQEAFAAALARWEAIPVEPY